jgi:hypothetical protein
MSKHVSDVADAKYRAQLAADAALKKAAWSEAERHHRLKIDAEFALNEHDRAFNAWKEQEPVRAGLIARYEAEKAQLLHEFLAARSMHDDANSAAEL